MMMYRYCLRARSPMALRCMVSRSVSSISDLAAPDLTHEDVRNLLQSAQTLNSALQTVTKVRKAHTNRRIRRSQMVFSLLGEHITSDDGGSSVYDERQAESRMRKYVQGSQQYEKLMKGISPARSQSLITDELLNVSLGIRTHTKTDINEVLRKSTKNDSVTKTMIDPLAMQRIIKQRENKGREQPAFLNKFQRPERIKNSERKIQLYGKQTAQSMADQMGISAGKILKVASDMKDREVSRYEALDTETAEMIVINFDMIPLPVKSNDIQVTKRTTGQDRPPVICVMGHVDHGKTTLLDYLRKTSIAEGESGGITQSIHGFQVPMEGMVGGFCSFIDTPGHAAFRNMRVRGAHKNMSDIVIIVICGKSGIKPQTIDSIKLAQQNGVPMIVVVNKIDIRGVDPNAIYNQLLAYDVVTEPLGGDILAVEISALTGQGIPELKEAIQLTSEMSDLKADVDNLAQACVVESTVHHGRGNVLEILVRDGTLSVGDYFVCGTQRGRVRTLYNYMSKSVESLGPSETGSLTGVDDLNGIGIDLIAVESLEKAKTITEERQRAVDLEKVTAREESVRLLEEELENVKDEEIASGFREQKRKWYLPKSMRTSIGAFKTEEEEDNIPRLKLILKSENVGSLEVMEAYCGAFPDQYVKLEVIKSGVGMLTESDVDYASSAGGHIVGFNLKPNKFVSAKADRENVSLFTDPVIYNCMDFILDVATKATNLITTTNVTGEAKVKLMFRLNGRGSNVIMCAGSEIINGEISLNGLVDVVRKKKVIHTGPIESIRVFKDTVKQVSDGECGIILKNFSDIQEGDIIRGYSEVQSHPVIDDSYARL